MLFKEIVDARTHARTHGRTTDDGRRTLKDHKSSLSTSCSGELIILVIIKAVIDLNVDFIVLQKNGRNFQFIFVVHPLSMHPEKNICVWDFYARNNHAENL